MSLRDILLDHAARYPRMEATDYAKLVYQSAFAGGHLIASRDAALARLRAEMANLPALADASPLIEPIGGGLCRLYLAPAKHMGLRAETVCGMFVETARAFKADRECFERDMAELEEMVRAGSLPIDADTVAALRDDCRAQNYAPFSHSARYRAAYAPAYRIVSAAMGELIDLFAAIDCLLARKGRARVAIDGACASGKSTAAALLARVYGAQLFHMDDYFLPMAHKTPERLAQPGGNVDWERFRAEILDHLDDETLVYRPFDCAAQQVGADLSAVKKPVQIIEGVYSLHPAMRGDYDLRVFLGINPALQRERVERRNPDMADRFMNEWIPLENRYFDAFGIAGTCDILRLL